MLGMLGGERHAPQQRYWGRGPQCLIHKQTQIQIQVVGQAARTLVPTHFQCCLLVFSELGLLRYP